ncbi:MAG: hypothetical protein ACLFN5_02285 [bacterium]
MAEDKLLEIIPEEGGYFLNLIFDGEEKATLFFVAERDFESLLRLANSPDKGWKELRNELFVLLEHTGHKKQHNLSEETTEKIKQVLQGRK